MILAVWVLAAVAVTLSLSRDRPRTFAALRKSSKSMRQLAPGLLLMILAVGLTLAIFPQEKLAKLFNVPGIEGFLLVAVVGAVVSIPGPIAFPLAGALLKMGARPEMLASFITTLTMVSLVTSPVEISMFGRSFTFWRQSISLLFAIMIGSIMGVLL